MPAGTTLTVTNADSDPHTLTADDGSFDTGRIDPGTSATITLDQPGTYTYHCNFHESMTGTIIGDVNAGPRVDSRASVQRATSGGDPCLSS